MKNFTQKFLILLISLFSIISINAQNDTLGFDAAIVKTPAGYALGTATINGYTWALSQAAQYSDPNDMFFGTKGLRMRKQTSDSCYIAMTQDKTTGLGSISFYSARSNFSGDRTGVSPIIVAQYSVDQGATWITVGSPIDLTGVNTLTKYNFPNINISGNVRIQIAAIGGDNGKRFNIDSLIFTSYAPTTCDVPTNLTTLDNTYGSIDVSWDAPTTAPADGYKIAIVATGVTPISSDYFTLPSTGTTFSTDTLTDGSSLMDASTYDVYIYAVCDEATVFHSDTTINTVVVSIVPCLAPTNLLLTDNTNGSIDISWTAPATAPSDGYQVAVVPTGVTPISTDFFTIPSSGITFSTDTLTDGTNLVDATTYDVYIYSICDAATAIYSDTINSSIVVSIIPPCIAPTNLTLTDNTDGSISVSWVAPANIPADGYQLAVVPSGATPITADFFTVPSTDVTFLTDSLKDGTSLIDASTYDVYIYSACNISTTDYSDTINNSVLVSIIPPCEGPTNVVLTNNGDGSITVTWTAPSTLPGNGYKLAVFAKGNTPVPFDYFTFHQDSISFTTDTLTNGATLAGGTEYVISIVAMCGGLSQSVPVRDTAMIILPTTCLVPTNVTVVNNENGSITVTWGTPVNIPTSYLIAIALNGTSPTAYFTISPSENTFTTDTLPDGSSLNLYGTYNVYVISKCGAGISPIDTSTVFIHIPCEFVTNLVSVDNTDGTMNVTWDAPSNIPTEGYVVAVVKEGDPITASDYFNVTSGTSFITDTLKNGNLLEDSISYVVSVVSVCQIGDSSAAVNDTLMVTIVICETPTNLVLSENGEGKITATWNATTELPGDGYQVAIVAEGTTPTASDYFNVVNTATSLSSDTLKNGTSIVPGDGYVVYLLSVCSATKISDTLIDTIQTTILPCPVPTSLMVTNNSDGSVNISWSSVTQPTNGYYYAIVVSGTTPIFPQDYVTTSATSVTNVFSTTGASATNFVEGGSYTVYVISSCDTWQGNSVEVSKNFNTTLSVSSIQSEITGLYPNPTSSTLTIEMSALSGNVSIVDLTGKVVYTNRLTSNSTMINVEELPAGMYQVKVATTNGTSFGKFIKE